MTSNGVATAISIHALLAESDVQIPPGQHRRAEFLSTLSLRRATACQPSQVYQASISIHALLAESDHVALCGYERTAGFLSTLSLRRATFFSLESQLTKSNFYPRSPCGERPPIPMFADIGHGISIHALLAESDSISFMCVPLLSYFYPRSPCGERHMLENPLRSIAVFLSTLSLRRAT